MQNYKEFFILGLPIDVENIGKAHFIKIKELPQFYLYQNVLTINKDKIIQMYKNQNMDEEAIDYFINQMSLYQWMMHFPEFKELYSQLFKFVFKEDVFDKVNEDNFDYLRQLIMDMNCVKEEKVNPNPEIQKWIDKSKKFKQNNEILTFEDIVTSVAVGTGYTYSYINNMTIYQFNLTFQRIGAFKGYDTSTLFATVSTEKINIESWCKNIDLFEEEKYGITRSEFNKLKKSVFQR